MSYFISPKGRKILVIVFCVLFLAGVFILYTQNVNLAKLIDKLEGQAQLQEDQIQTLKNENQLLQQEGQVLQQENTKFKEDIQQKSDQLDLMICRSIQAYTFDLHDLKSIQKSLDVYVGQEYGQSKPTHINTSVTYSADDIPEINTVIAHYSMASEENYNLYFIATYPDETSPLGTLLDQNLHCYLVPPGRK